MQTWTKRIGRTAARREAAGLSWLAGAEGGVVTPQVLDVTEELVCQRIERATPEVETARRFGGQLARSHAAGAGWWGEPPPGCTGDGTIGAAVLSTPVDPPTSWGAFYAEHRVLPHVRAARDAGTLTTAQTATLERVCARIGDGAVDHPQPAMVGDTPARLHGDLWNGNVLWSPTGLVVIDPAAHGGHAETDLAMLDLFGLPHLADVLQGYQEISAPAPGWRERVALHQLHPLAVHTELFGAGYAEQLLAAARQVG